MPSPLGLTRRRGFFWRFGEHGLFFQYHRSLILGRPDRGETQRRSPVIVYSQYFRGNGDYGIALAGHQSAGNSVTYLKSRGAEDQAAAGRPIYRQKFLPHQCAVIDNQTKLLFLFENAFMFSPVILVRRP